MSSNEEATSVGVMVSVGVEMAVLLVYEDPLDRVYTLHE